MEKVMVADTRDWYGSMICVRHVLSDNHVAAIICP